MTSFVVAWEFVGLITLLSASQKLAVEVRSLVDALFQGNHYKDSRSRIENFGRAWDDKILDCKTR